MARATFAKILFRHRGKGRLLFVSLVFLLCCGCEYVETGSKLYPVAANTADGQAFLKANPSNYMCRSVYLFLSVGSRSACSFITDVNAWPRRDHLSASQS